MPIAKFQLPDGRVARFEVAEGTTPEQARALMESHFAPKPQESQKTKYDPTDGMSTFEKAAAGVGKAIVDTGRGIGQFLPDWMPGHVSRADVEESRKLDAPLMDTAAGRVGNIAGNVGMALLPGAALKGAGAVASGYNATRAAAPILTATGNALLAPKSIAGAGALGVGMGAIQPSASTGETIGNMAIGGVASAALPLLVRGYQVAKSAAEPFYDAGRRRIEGGLLRDMAGGEAEKALRNLREASQPFVGAQMDGEPVRRAIGEIVPGSLPTMAQVADVPSLAALERTLAQTNPTIQNAYFQRMKDQGAAQVDLLRRMAGEGGKRDFFAAARDAAADELYGAAMRSGVDVSKLSPAARENIAAFSRRVPRPVVRQAELLAQINGTPLTDKTSVQGMHWIKKGLDSSIQKESGAGGSGELKRAYTGLKNDLLTGLDNLSPLYGEARRTYEAMSKPVNQMDTIQEILNSVKPMKDALTPDGFGRVFNDQAAKNATGFRGATLENTLEQNQLQALEALKDDLKRRMFASSAGRGVGLDTAQKLAYSNMVRQAGFPSWLTGMKPAQGIGNIAARVTDIGYKGANEQMSRDLAEAILEPNKFIGLLEAAAPNQKEDLVKQFISRGGAGAGMMIPGLLNGGK